MVGLSHRALMDIRTRLPQQYDDLQGSGQKPGSKRVGLSCCAIIVLYLRNSRGWKALVLLIICWCFSSPQSSPGLLPLQRAGWYWTSRDSRIHATRAILLARATIAQLIPRLAMSCWTQRARALGFNLSFHRYTTARAP